MFGQAYDGKRVLVTGHTGFKGTWLTQWLQRLGATVVGVSDKVPTTPSHFEAAGVAATMQSHELDVRSPELAELIGDESPDFVFHLAAQALVKESYDNPADTFSTNAIGTANVLDGLRRIDTPCTAILITSDKCYENVETYYGYRETDRLGGADPYSASKAAAELVISSYHRSFFEKPEPVRLAVTRAGNVVGGGDWAADRLVPDIVRAWDAGEKVSIRRPQATRPWQHVLEPLSGYLHLGAELAQRGELHGEAFNFGPPAEAVNPVRDVVLALQEYLPDLDLVIDESGATFHEAGLLKLSCDKALSSLGWQPVLDFDQTMKMTAEWYREFYAGPASGMAEVTNRQLSHYSRQASGLGLPWAATVK